MKACISLLFTLFLWEPVLSQSTVYLAIVTLVQKQDVSTTQYQLIDTAMHADETKMTKEIGKVARSYQKKFATSTAPVGNWQVRNRDLQQCNPCAGFPTGWYCWYRGVLRPACRRDRGLTVHKALDETELSEMSEEDRQRHLQASDMCAAATENVVKEIQGDINAGRITAPLSSFTHQCLYEVV